MFRYWTCAVHAVAFIIILLLPVTLYIKVGGSILIGLLFFYNFFLSKKKKFLIRSFVQETKDSWQLYTACGEKYVARLLKKNYVSDFLVILRFAGAARPVFLFRYQLSEQDWRSLQMILRN